LCLSNRRLRNSTSDTRPWWFADGWANSNKPTSVFPSRASAANSRPAVRLSPYFKNEMMHHSNSALVSVLEAALPPEVPAALVMARKARVKLPKLLESVALSATTSALSATPVAGLRS